MSEHHYVYRLEDKITKEFYWGVRTCKCEIKDDPYMGSMQRWKPNKANLVKTDIIEYPSRIEANAAEYIIVRFYMNKTKFPLNRNYCYGRCAINDEETRRKMSISAKKRGPNGVGRKASAETLEKMRIISTGKKQSPETIQKRVDKIKGQKRPQHSERMKGENNPFYGKKHSEEAKAIIREKRLNRNHE